MEHTEILELDFKSQVAKAYDTTAFENTKDIYKGFLCVVIRRISSKITV